MYLKNANNGQSLLKVIIILSIVFGLLFYFLLDIETGDRTAIRLKKESLAKKNALKKKIISTQTKSKNASLPELVNKVKNSVILITTYDALDKKLATGTGFAIKKKGIIATNRHVIAGAARIEIKLKGKTVPVNSIVGISAKSDIALLSISDTDKTPKVLKAMGNSFVPKIGSSIFVVGNPLGFESTVSTGVISAIRRIKPFGKVIQITAPISPGSSGSPVFNMKGEVIGIATFVVMNGQNLNFSIPISRLNIIKIKKSIKLSNISKMDLDYFSGLDTALEKGEYLISNKEYNSALTYFKDALKEEPNNSEILINIGICYREIGMTQKAIDTFNQVTKKNYDNLQVHYELGKTYMNFNMPEKALRELDIVLAKEPDYEKLNLQYGIVLTEMKEYKKATYYLEKAIEDDFDFDSYFLLGLVYYKTNQINKATNAFREAYDLDRTNIKCIHMLGLLYYEAGNFRFSIDTLNKGVLLAPNNGNIHFQLGMTYLAYKDLENAELEYKILDKLKYKNKHKLRRAISDYKYHKKYN